MAKNPYCPIYYNDLLGATRDWTDEEFGCYVRLLLEQWDKGFIPNPYQNSAKILPNDVPNDFQRLARISAKVEQNWSLIGKKFVRGEEGLINLNMEVIRCNMLKFSKKQTENALKRYQNAAKSLPNELPNACPRVEYEYIYSIIRFIQEEDKDYMIKEEEKKVFMYLVAEMSKMFIEKNKDYFFDKETDYTACLQIAYKIAEMKKWKKYDVINGKLTECLESWKTIIEFIGNDEWFKTRSLSHISSIKEWQSLVQKMNNKKQKLVKGNKNSFI